MEKIIRCVVLVLVTMVFGAHLGVNGLCVWPCSRQHRTYIFVGSLSTTAEFSLPGNLTFIETTDSVLTHVQCIERSGPFYSVRINNGSHDLYRCNKDALYHPEDDVIVIYANEYRYFETPPTICDVCDGKDYNIVLTARDEAVSNCRIPSDDEIPELGCNIPRICPVTMNGQIQCTRCEPSQGDDDGLCCKPKRVVYRYKNNDKPSRPNRDYRRNRPSRYNKRNRQSKYHE